MGQVQLVCMARAMPQKPKILIIDEGEFCWLHMKERVTCFVTKPHTATASVEEQSDRLIQHALQTQFPDTTILCVAHCISTLVWMDHIVVMANGKFVEQGSPRELLEQ